MPWHWPWKFVPSTLKFCLFFPELLEMLYSDTLSTFSRVVWLLDVDLYECFAYFGR